MNAATLMVQYLEATGVRHLFGYPGTPNLELIESARNAGFTLVTPRREGTAAFMAEAYGMLTGLPGVCFSTLGPGSTSLVNGVANAMLDRAPMIAVSGQTSTRREPYWTHQVVDHRRVFAPITKWTTNLVPESTGVIMRKALRTAMAERPGPVHISTHGDVLGVDVDDAEVRLPPIATSQTAPRVVSAPGVDPDPVARLQDARRPMLVVGAGVLRAGATDALLSLAERTGCPIVVAPGAKGALPEEHRCFAGTLDMACGPVVWDFLDGADLLLAVGFDAAELIRDWTLDAATIHIDAVPNTDQVYPAEIELIGDAGATLDALASAFAGEPRWDASDIEAHRARISDVYYSGRVEGKLNPSDVTDALNDHCPPGTHVSTDVGSHKLLVGQGWRGAGPGTFLVTNGLSSMGFALPAAITAKLLRPESPVVCTTGDGGFAMVQGELAVAADLGLGVIVLVFCDESLHRIEIKQRMRGYPGTMTRVPPTDLVALAGAMHCHGERVETGAQLGSVLETALRGIDRPFVVECRIDPAQYESQF